MPQLDLEGTLNMGIGMIAVVAQDTAHAAIGGLAESGLAARVIGEIVDEASLPAPSGPLERIVSGAKGVDGGGVLLTGQHPGWQGTREA